ncbi:hypothetical protein ACQ4PT_029990 [Festuca glaucescens]
MAGLHSPRVVSCIGGRDNLFLEFAPGGSLADKVAKSGGLDEPTVRAYAADVARGLAYLHGESMVHGDVKSRNVVIGADGSAKLADFGCARKTWDGAGGKMIGGTPAFMAPEVARGEEQGPAADVWALGCTVIEMVTGRAPCSGMDGDALAAMHRIGYTDAVPEVPQWLSAEAKDFLAVAGCLIREPIQRCSAAQLLEHPFLASTGVDAKLEEDVKNKWMSPKSTLDAALLGRGRAVSVAKLGREDEGIGVYRLCAAGLGVRRGLDRRALRNRSPAGRENDGRGGRRSHMPRTKSRDRRSRRLRR